MAAAASHNDNEISRQEIKSAIAKAVELRALHAALIQGTSPAANIRFPSSPPASHHFSAQDYPVFTPSYEDEQASGYVQNQTKTRTLSETWDEYGIESASGHQTPSDYKSQNFSKKSVTGSSTNHITVLQTSPIIENFKLRRRKSLGDFKSVSSCNKCNRENAVVPLTDSHASVQSQSKSRGIRNLSWLLSRFKKKNKQENCQSRTESEEVSQVFKDLGVMSIETMKKQVIEANENRDAALMEVSEMKSSLQELKQKLEYLETYCEELKKTLVAKDSNVPGKIGTFLKNGNRENLMPVSEEVMVEGFLQIVSESRLSVKQFCKTLLGQIEESDNSLMESLNQLLQPYKLSLDSKNSKSVFYHLEAIINQTLYQNFENCIFQANGSPKLLNPLQNRQERFASFVALRNLSWNEVLRKGTKCHSEEFSKFCDEKMSSVITKLNWTRPWHEKLLQVFFVAAKCVWLLHLLAFSFDPHLGILRVDENRNFDSHYMDEILIDRQKNHGPSRVKVMVMPGFYVGDRVLRCKVVCRYK